QQSSCEIDVRELSKQFGHRRVVDRLTFTVQPGRVTGFLGPNGAGKTTTLRMLLGLVTPTQGAALIGGRKYQDLGSPGRTVGALLEAAGFHPGRSGRDHLRTYAGPAGVADARIDEVLARVGLARDGRRHVRGYSLGMRQRLGVAAAILTDPPVLICDEPTNGLDPEGIRWLRGLLRERAGRGHTVLVSSHLLAEMQQIVDSVVIISHGRVVYDGDVGAVGSATVRVSSPDAATLHKAITSRAGDTVRVQPAGEDTLLVRGVSAEQLGRIALRAQVPLTQLATETGNLEQLFFSLTETETGAGRDLGSAAPAGAQPAPTMEEP
ncbi:MAG TPA: ABC transporter ATP-binding protein, partial [Streptosporangiaceae bacterium]|nr:ABC transporter ATP-binding protein [Streptosporangiaceae bacterium]